MSRTLILLLLRGFGTGYTPGMPGTVGSLLAFVLSLPLYLFRSQIGGITVTLALIALAFLTGFITWIGFRACRDEWQEFDPSEIVLDEFAGTFFIMGVASMIESPVWMFAGFVLFRLFDMLKPFPIHHIEQMDRYAGLVLDDLMAGFMASLGIVAIWITL